MNSWFEDNGNNNPLLKRDDCFVRFKNELKEDLVHVYAVYKDCYKVSFFIFYIFIIRQNFAKKNQFNF